MLPAILCDPRFDLLHIEPNCDIFSAILCPSVVGSKITQQPSLTGQAIHPDMIRRGALGPLFIEILDVVGSVGGTNTAIQTGLIKRPGYDRKKNEK